MIRMRSEFLRFRQSPTLSLAYASISDEGIVEVSKFLRDNPFVKPLG